MPFRFLPVLLGALALGACAPTPTDDRPTASAVTPSGLRVERAEVREGLPGVPDGVLYLTLRGAGRANVTLRGARTPLARRVTPMLDHGDAAAPLDLTVEPGSELAFSPGGAHLMLEGLRRPPRVGETVSVTLSFTDGDVTLDVPVNPY